MHNKYINRYYQPLSLNNNVRERESAGVVYNILLVVRVVSSVNIFIYFYRALSRKKREKAPPALFVAEEEKGKRKEEKISIDVKLSASQPYSFVN